VSHACHNNATFAVGDFPGDRLVQASASLLGIGKGTAEHGQVFRGTPHVVIKLVAGMHPDSGQVAHDRVVTCSHGDGEGVLRTVAGVAFVGKVRVLRRIAFACVRIDFDRSSNR